MRGGDLRQQFPHDRDLFRDYLEVLAYANNLPRTNETPLEALVASHAMACQAFAKVRWRQLSIEELRAGDQR